MIHSLQVVVHSRSKKHTAAAAVAYRCGLTLIDRHGELHKYEHREDDVIDYDIVGGDFGSQQEWADAIEKAETRKNSQLFRDFQIALPHELDEDDQVELTKRFAGTLAERYSTSALWAVHHPSAEGDARNVHGHILLPTREMSAPASFVGGAKNRQLDPEALRGLHDEWDIHQADAMHSAGKPLPDPSDVPQPSVHLGPQAVALERETASTLDKRAKRETKSRKLETPRRSVAQLLDYTHGVTDRGQAWLAQRDAIMRCRQRVEHLVKRLSEAKAALARTREILKKLLDRRAVLAKARHTQPERPRGQSASPAADNIQEPSRAPPDAYDADWADKSLRETFRELAADDFQEHAEDDDEEPGNSPTLG